MRPAIARNIAPSSSRALYRVTVIENGTERLAVSLSRNVIRTPPNVIQKFDYRCVGAFRAQILRDSAPVSHLLNTKVRRCNPLLGSEFVELNTCMQMDYLSRIFFF